MKVFSLLIVLLLSQVGFVASASAGDFDWLDSLNVTAESDSSGFRVRLATRFHLGDAQVSAVIGDVSHPSDAYMVFRLGELSHRPINEVISVYHAHRNQGWGVMAKHLGIKPGSREFHALKRGHDMSGGHEMDSGHPSGKHKAKGMGNGKGKGKH